MAETSEVEIYKRHRPKSLDEMVGQEAAVRTLRGYGSNLPHALLFAGPSGVGKTTLARIVARLVGAKPIDYREINTADFRGVDTIRDLRQQMTLAPSAGKARVWTIDEAHQLTKDAQHAILKMLEDTPRHVYFVLATTEPGKLLPTVRNRCTLIQLRALSPKELEALVARSASDAAPHVRDPKVRAAIVEAAGGSARRALVLLDAAAAAGDKPAEQLAAVTRDDEEEAGGILLARALFAPRASWGSVAAAVKAVAEEEPETVRRIVLGYARAVLLGGGAAAERAAEVVEAFRAPYYDCGAAGLALSAYRAVVAK